MELIFLVLAALVAIVGGAWIARIALRLSRLDRAALRRRAIERRRKNAERARRETALLARARRDIVHRDVKPANVVLPRVHLVRSRGQAPRRAA